MVGERLRCDHGLPAQSDRHHARKPSHGPDASTPAIAPPVEGFQQLHAIPRTGPQGRAGGVGHPVADRPEHGESHRVLPRAGPFHVHGREGRGLAQGVAERDDPDLVGRVLVGPGAVQHGDGPGRDAPAALVAEGRDLGQRPVAGDAQGGRRRDLHLPRRPGRLAASGSGGSSCWAAGRARARFGSSPRSATS